MSPLKCPYSKNINQIMPNLYNLQFTDTELDTIAAAMDDYIAYDDPDASEEDLIGGLSVESRVTSICRKLMKHLKIKELDTQIQGLSN